MAGLYSSSLGNIPTPNQSISSGGLTAGSIPAGGLIQGIVHNGPPSGALTFRGASPVMTVTDDHNAQRVAIEALQYVSHIASDETRDIMCLCMRLGQGKNFPLPFRMAIHRHDNGDRALFISKGDESMILVDDAVMFPSDGLLTKIRMLL